MDQQPERDFRKIRLQRMRDHLGTTMELLEKPQSKETSGAG
jgi:hypothetical protein